MTPFSNGSDLYFLGLATFLGGLLFGTLRQWSANILPALAAHIFFDLTVYGGYLHAPWWVWS
jgi:membrane protease YdiL (CAAX protease family)